MRQRLALVVLGVFLCVSHAAIRGSGRSSSEAQPTPPESRRTRLSFHNRLLLNRVVINKLPTVEVMLAVREKATRTVIGHVERLNGRVLRSDERAGYVRAEVPPERFLELVASEDVEAYQISSLAKGVWYRDGPPQRNAEMFRGFETQPPAMPKPPAASSLPALSVTRATEPGYTAGEDAGVAAWHDAHPRADGRGVTIAILESALADFDHPTTRSARSLDGREVRKIAGVLNTIDPSSPDATRVELSVAVRAADTWVQVGLRTYVLPRPGTYRFGLFILPAGANLTHQFGVLGDERSGEVWVDANGNADFTDETPVSDVNDRLDVRRLTLVHPASGHISFVVARGRAPNTVHVYLATGGHQAMTLSVAAGSRTDDSPAIGVAPGAQVLLVRKSNTGSRLDEYIEGYLDVVRRSDVDVLTDSSGVHVVPDTAADFVALMLDRFVSAYGKPIFHSAGNRYLRLGSVSSGGGVLSVGGTLGPGTFEAFYGGPVLRELVVHPTGAAGPAVDGAIKPDFLAPMHVVAADTPGDLRSVAIPLSAPTARLPSGHQISCCTSASSPYAAGVAALLISRAKQEGIPYSVLRLGRALRLGATFLPGAAAHEQGNGVLNVESAWRELTSATDSPRITSSARIVTPFAMYTARGDTGTAIFEQDGWFAGKKGARSLTLRRENGASTPIVYNITWTGNDGTFHAPRSVTLPLNVPVTIPITVAVTAAGAHSALLNLHDASTGAVLFRTQATIVAAERFESMDRPLVLAGTVPLMAYRPRYIAIPDGIGALGVEVTVTRGMLNTTILRHHGLSSAYYDTVNPAAPRAFGPGTYSVTIPRPEPGTWTVGFGNDRALQGVASPSASSSDAEYSVTLRLFGASLAIRPSGSDSVAIEVTNLASPLETPALDVSEGLRRLHRSTLLATASPNQFPIDVPTNAAALTLALKGDQASSLLDLHLYDCTTGQCFSHSFTLPAARSQAVVVHKPRPGRWLAAVNGAPFAQETGSFVLEEIVTTGDARRIALPSPPRRTGDRWAYEVPLASTEDSPAGGRRVLRLELVDLAFDRDARSHPWENIRGRAPESAAVGTATYIRK
jgi:hypothetical protein